MKSIIALLLLSVIAISAVATDRVSWTNAVNALGLAVESNEYRDATAVYGPSTRNPSGANEIIYFKSSGIGFTANEGRIIAVQMRIAPGNSIKDVRYTGDLPEGVMAAISSAEDAIRIMGPPLSDVRKGYRELGYLVQGKVMTLHYGPQLDYVTFTDKPAGQSGAGNRAPRGD